jgi:hypothetical protein
MFVFFIVNLKNIFKQPHHTESTNYYYSIIKVKQRCAQLIFGWVAARESAFFVISLLHFSIDQLYVILNKKIQICDNNFFSSTYVLNRRQISVLKKYKIPFIISYSICFQFRNVMGLLKESFYMNWNLCPCELNMQGDEGEEELSRKCRQRCWIYSLRFRLVTCE